MSNTTFRHTFTNLCSEKLYEFVENHQNEERLIFKKSWKEWIINNNDLIINESLLLKLNGYKGDAIDKMFISVRFYLKKRVFNSIDHIEKIDKKEEEDKIIKKHTSNDIIKIINDHIKINITKFSPSDLFKDFSITHKNELIDIEDIKKQKKIYKNRYYIIKKSMI